MLAAIRMGDDFLISPYPEFLQAAATPMSASDTVARRHALQYCAVLKRDKHRKTSYTLFSLGCENCDNRLSKFTCNPGAPSVLDVKRRASASSSLGGEWYLPSAWQAPAADHATFGELATTPRRAEGGEAGALRDMAVGELPMSMLPTGEAVARSHFDARVVDESGAGAQLVAAANALLEKGDELVGKALAAPIVAKFEGALVSAMTTVGAVVSQVAEGNGSGILSAASDAMAPQRTPQPAVQLRQKLLRIHQWPEFMPGAGIEIRCLAVELPRVNANFTRVVECPRSAVRGELGVSTRPPPVTRHSGSTATAAASSGASGTSMHAVHGGTPAAAGTSGATSSTPTIAASTSMLKVGSSGGTSLARTPPQPLPLTSHTPAAGGGSDGGAALTALLSPEPPTPYGMLSAQSPVSFFPTTYVAPSSEHAAAARARNVPITAGGSMAGGAPSRSSRSD
ncbi:hypothetical protein EON67_02325, partial [archaeon]